MSDKNKKLKTLKEKITGAFQYAGPYKKQMSVLVLVAIICFVLLILQLVGVLPLWIIDVILLLILAAAVFIWKSAKKKK